MSGWRLAQLSLRFLTPVVGNFDFVLREHETCLSAISPSPLDICSFSQKLLGDNELPAGAQSVMPRQAQLNQPMTQALTSLPSFSQPPAQRLKKITQIFESALGSEVDGG